eukprot:1085230-Rhodomonas_salina.1
MHRLERTQGALLVTSTSTTRVTPGWLLPLLSDSCTPHMPCVAAYPGTRYPGTNVIHHPPAAVPR